ncbi:nitroreductase family protein [Streptomyces klenkii]|uniref:nitroreductase family protein n=1 Tax=Streptomyces klenkii TaxID=1420899 RepID=UPI0033C91F41
MSTRPLTGAPPGGAAEQYAELTFDRMPSVVPRGLPAEPPPWVRATGGYAYEWIRPLPGSAADPLVDWSAASPAAPPAPSGPGGSRRESGAPLDLRALSGLLALGAGVTCVEFGPQSSWPRHRIAPSARCVFPCSVRVVGRGPGGAEPDVAHYHPEHHQLRGRVPFRHRRWTSVDCVVTAAPGTTGAHYGDYAYRLVCQEAGLLLGSLLLAARTLGLRADAVPWCPDEMDRLLSLDGRCECSMAMVRLSGSVTGVTFPGPDVQGPRVRRPCEPVEDLGALSAAAHREFARTRPRAVSSGAASGTPDASVGGPPAGPPDTAGARSPDTADGPPAGHPPAAAGPVPVRLPWRRVGTARDSGDPGFIPSPLPIAADALERLCSAALTTAFPALWHGLPPVALLVARRNVPGADHGLFRYDGTAPAPARRLLPGTAVTPFLRGCQMVASTNGHQAPATVFITVDLDRWLRHDAARAYADLHLRSGEAAQRLLMAASAEGLIARIHNGFLTGPLREACGPGRWIAPFAVLVSRRRPSARYRFVLDGGL